MLHGRLVLAPEDLSALKAEDPQTDSGESVIAYLRSDLRTFFLTYVGANIAAIKKVGDFCGHESQPTAECLAETDGGSVTGSWRSMTC